MMKLGAWRERTELTMKFSVLKEKAETQRPIPIKRKED